MVNSVTGSNSSLCARSLVNNVASMTTSQQEEILDFSSSSNLKEVQETSIDDNTQLSGLIDVLKGLIATLQAMFGGQSAVDTASKNSDTKVTQTSKTDNTTATNTNPQAGDVVDLNLAGVGKIKDAEVMSLDEVDKFFDEISFNPNAKMSGKKLIEMDDVANVYKTENENGEETLYFTDENNEILYKASFWKRQIGEDGRGYHVYQYTKDDDMYHITHQKGGTDPTTGATGILGGYMSPWTVNAEGKMIGINGKYIR